MSTVAILVFFLVGVLSLLGIIYPFRPFRTRKRALWSFLACFVGFIVAAISAPPTAGTRPNVTAGAEPQGSSSPTADVADGAVDAADTAASEPDPVAGALPTEAPDVGASIRDRPKPRPSASGSIELDHPIRTGTNRLPPAEGAPPRAGTPNQIAAEDIYWDDDTRPFQTELLIAANRIQAENAECGKVEDIVKSDSRSKKDDPVFFVACSGTKGIPFNIWFRPKDAEAAGSFAAVRPIGQGSALVACEKAAHNAANNPHSVDFSIFFDVSYREFPNGRAILSSTFTAKNAFNAEFKYAISCYFDGMELSEVEVSETR